MSTKEKSAETDEATAKGGKKKLLLIVLVVLLAAAGAAYFFLFTGGEAAAEEPVAGTVLPLDPIAVNLDGWPKDGAKLRLQSAGILTLLAGECGAFDHQVEMGFAGGVVAAMPAMLLALIGQHQRGGN